MKEVIQELKQVLADSYALYVKTQNYHWNVTGPNFKSLHSLFEEQYQDLADAVDNIAERIRGLGAKAPGTFKEYQELTIIKDGDCNAKADAMVEQLSNDQALILKALNKLLQVAQSANDEATINLISDRIAAHEKHHWMLSSSL